MDPSSTRVAVVGAGPSGLSAAVGLVKLDYKHVTVLEEQETVGGMCASAVVDDRVYDLGGQVLARESCPTIMSIVRELNLEVEMEDMSKHRLAKIDLNTGRYEDFNMATDYVALMAITSELETKAAGTGKLGIHALSALAHEPAPVFLRQKGTDLPGALASAYTGSGYGFVEDIPYAYVHEFLRSSMLGKIWRVKGGYGSLWDKVAQTLPDVRCNVKVQSIDRSNGDVVRISVQQLRSQERVLEFDKVILTGSLAFPRSNRTYRSAFSADEKRDIPIQEAGGVLDYTDEEQKLFRKVRMMEYYTTAVTISGLDLPVGFYFPENARDSSAMGHIVAFQRFFADADVYLTWSYGNAECDQQRVTYLLQDDIRRMGGRVESVILQRKWDYCPHVSSEDMAEGFYDKLEDLQGRKNTYYVGGLLAFELTERNAAFALALTHRCFRPIGHSSDQASSARSSKNRLQIQTLMPVSADLDEDFRSAQYAIKEATEILGVDSFPTLPSVDAYLSFYGSHKVKRHIIAYKWVNDQGHESDTLTYGQLDSRASIVAQRLATGKNALKPGDRVLMVYQPGLEFIEAFLGCLRARVLPVPVIPPDPLKPYDQALFKVASVTKASGAKVILSTSSYHNVVRAASLRKAVLRQKAPSTKNAGPAGPPPQWPNIPWLHTDSWTRGSTIKEGFRAWAAGKTNRSSANKERIVDFDNQTLENDAFKSKENRRNDSEVKCESPIIEKSSMLDAPGPKPSDLCFLQFTSGSTGDPKGVMIGHGALLHNILCMKRAYRGTSSSVTVSWLPQYHDMGLIGAILTPLVCGGCGILFSPQAFIRKPLMWLELIARYKGTHAVAPNFAFELLVKRFESLRSNPSTAEKQHKNYDLSSIRFFLSAAEPIRAGTMQRFLRLFHSLGIRETMIATAYGLAENCVFVSCSYGECKPLLTDWDGRVCVGYTRPGDPHQDVRIVNMDTFEEQSEGIEGEIWVCSPSNGMGYWGLKELSEQTFSNRLSSSSDGKKFLRTGDLGKVIKGHIFVTGRIKDLIIIQGRNIYPSDIERTVENCSDDVRPGCSAAFSAPLKVLKSKGVVQYLNSSEQDDNLVDVCVVVVAEVRDEKNIDAAVELVSIIKSAVASEHGINVAYVEIIKPRSIPKTTSGKIRRFECLQRFSEGTLLSIRLPDASSLSEIRTRRKVKNDIMSRKRVRSYQTGSTSNLHHRVESRKAGSPPTKDEIEIFLIETLAERTRLQKAEISVDENFSNYADSVVMTWVASKLSEFLHVHVPPLQLYTSSSIAEIADWSFHLLVRNSKEIRETTPQTSPDLSTPSYEWQDSKGRINDRNALVEVLAGLVAQKTSVSTAKISVKESLSDYSLTSLDSVWIAQEMSNHLGVHIPPLQLYTASSIEELAENCLALSHSAGPQLTARTETSQCYAGGRSQYMSSSQCNQEISENFEVELISDKELASAIEPSKLRQSLITGLQVLGLLFIAALLLIPASMIYGRLLGLVSAHQLRILRTLLAVALVPAAWMLYIAAVGLTICAIGCTILKPNYALQSAIPLWSARYVRWWSLYRLQDFASKSLAVHLRGTVLLVWWYRLMGAQIGDNVHIDTTDITDPSLLYIGNDTIVEEDATLQSHDVRAGAVRFDPIRIGSRCVVGSFSVIQRGTTMEAGSRIETLSKTHPGQVLQPPPKSNPEVASMKGAPRSLVLRQLCGVYLQGLISTISAMLAYAMFRSVGPTFGNTKAESSSKFQEIEAEASLLFPLVLTFPWALLIVAPITLFSRHDPALFFEIMVGLNSQLPALLLGLSTSFVVYGIILGALTSTLKWYLIGNPRSCGSSNDHQRPIERILFPTLVARGLLRSAHLKFFVLLSGTEAFCIYLRSLGANIGRAVSIRRVNALIDPDFLRLGDNCHLGDFSKVVATKITRSTRTLQMSSNIVHLGECCVVGAQSVVLPGVTMGDGSILGAMSVAPDTMFLQDGGVYVGGRDGNATVMISRQPASVDLRIEEMDKTYRKIVGKLTTDIARSTVTSAVNGKRLRYFHQAGVAGRGTLRMLDNLRGLPRNHELFFPGRSYPVVIRHSNALSTADDRCPDAKGASLRILSTDSPDDVGLSVLDLVMKTGECLHARSMLDLMTWEAKSYKAQEEYVQQNPRIGQRLWGQIRSTDSYSELHYYSVLARVLRSGSTSELPDSNSGSTAQADCFVKFRLCPNDRTKFDVSHGSVIASSPLPPPRGYLPASPGDERSTDFLRKEFKLRLKNGDGAKYILQLQMHRIPESPKEVNQVLDPTVAWDEAECPFIDIAELTLNMEIADEVAENMTFNSRNGGQRVAVVAANSAADSASIDHCRSVVYDIASTIRKGLPLPGAWRDLLRVENLDLGSEVPSESPQPTRGCPVMSPFIKEQDQTKARKVGRSSTSRLEMAIMKGVQPLLQAAIPVALLALSAYPGILTMSYTASKVGEERWLTMFPFMLPMAFATVGVVFAMLSICCRWLLLGRNQEGAITELWSWHTLCFTILEAIIEVLKGTFLELTRGTLLYNTFLKLLGASIGTGVYIDSLNVLNPDQLRIGAGSVVGRNALFFGHLYDGQKVFYKSNVIGDFCTVGTHALTLPGSQMCDGSELGALELGMKDEVIASY